MEIEIPFDTCNTAYLAHGCNHDYHECSRGVYGAPRVHAELVHGRCISNGQETVSLLMWRADLHGLPTYRRPEKPIKPITAVTDIVKWNFKPTRPKDFR